MDAYTLIVLVVDAVQTFAIGLLAIGLMRLGRALRRPR